jgi:hypothetical protein
MPKQNRVTPFGDIVAVPDRGTVMGNRGRLHDENGRVGRTWQVRRWIACVLDFKGRKRQVMRPGYYTELFFLDEATALAAGHRPCAECRRERFNAFRVAWRAAHGTGSSPLPTAGEMDDRLHAERVTPDRSKQTFVAALGKLPDGVMVRHDGLGDEAHLVLGDGLLPWSPSAYTGRVARPSSLEVTVLTPESTVAAIRAGYAPDIHPPATPWT